MNKYRESVSTFLENYFDKQNAETKIVDSIKYSLLGGGKMIRSSLMLGLFEDLNKDWKSFVPLAAAIEMIHTYSLIHDDLPALDDDKYRRNKLTNHLVYGEDFAILAGDSLLTHAFDAVTHINLEAEKKVWLIQELVKVSGINQGMINGQVLDIENQVDNIADLANRHAQKTGALFNYCLVAPTTILDDDVAKFNKLASLLGLYYQIQDDYLDFYGSFVETGKEIKKDVGNHKITYGTMYTKEQLEKLLNDIELQMTDYVAEHKNLKTILNSIIIRKG